MTKIKSSCISTIYSLLTTYNLRLTTILALLIVLSSCSQQRLFTESKYNLKKVPVNSIADDINKQHESNTNISTQSESIKDIIVENKETSSEQIPEETIKKNNIKRIQNSKFKIQNSLISLLSSSNPSLKQITATQKALNAETNKKQSRAGKILSKVLRFLDIPNDKLLLYLAVIVLAVLLIIVIGPAILFLLTILLLAVVILILIHYLL